MSFLEKLITFVFAGYADDVLAHNVLQAVSPQTRQTNSLSYFHFE